MVVAYNVAKWRDMTKPERERHLYKLKSEAAANAKESGRTINEELTDLFKKLDEHTGGIRIFFNSGEHHESGQSEDHLQRHARITRAADRANGERKNSRGSSRSAPDDGENGS